MVSDCIKFLDGWLQSPSHISDRFEHHAHAVTESWRDPEFSRGLDTGHRWPLATTDGGRREGCHSQWHSLTLTCTPSHHHSLCTHTPLWRGATRKEINGISAQRRTMRNSRTVLTSLHVACVFAQLPCRRRGTDMGCTLELGSDNLMRRAGSYSRRPIILHGPPHPPPPCSATAGGGRALSDDCELQQSGAGQHGGAWWGMVGRFGVSGRVCSQREDI